MARGDVLRRAQQILDEREAHRIVDVLEECLGEGDAVVDENLGRLRRDYRDMRTVLRDVLNDLGLPGADSE